MKLIEPKVRGFLCTTAHPLGCKTHVKKQIEQVLAHGLDNNQQTSPKRVLIIGGSAGYGLSSRIVCAAGYGAKTLSVALEKPPQENRPGSAGWYNNYFLEQWISKQSGEAYSINGDAFSLATKQQTLEVIESQFGQVDLVVYSLAAPRRIKVAAETGNAQTYQSVIKPIGQSFEGPSIDTVSGKLKSVELPPATVDEIDHTVTVMGGEDWFDWIKLLSDRGLIAEQFQTVAFSYLGGELTKAIYGAATLGAAKQDVENYCQEINDLLACDRETVKARVAVLKAIVTQSSAAIPSLPLYISALYQVMKAEGNHEGCIEQILRLFNQGLYSTSVQCRSDRAYRLRLDDEELKPHIQNKVKHLWDQVSQQNLTEITDFEGYRSDFLKLFGFAWSEVDYSQPVSCIPDH